MESLHPCTWERSSFRACLMFISLANRSAPHSSNRGMVSFLSGATFVLAATKVREGGPLE